MPTGYTAAIKDGISFQQYALNCARAFGALITMRHDPSDAPIPAKFEPSDFYAQSLKKAEDQLARLLAMSPDECDSAALKQYLDACEMNNVRRKENADLRNKYNAMLAEAVAWNPPTVDHEKMKEFMIEQLQSSINWDCSESYIVDPPKRSGKQWLADSLADCHDRIVRYTDEHAAEVERTNKRNEWVDALRKSLGA